MPCSSSAWPSALIKCTVEIVASRMSARLFPSHRLHCQFAQKTASSHPLHFPIPSVPPSPLVLPASQEANFSALAQCLLVQTCLLSQPQGPMRLSHKSNPSYHQLPAPLYRVQSELQFFPLPQAQAPPPCLPPLLPSPKPHQQAQNELDFHISAPHSAKHT